MPVREVLLSLDQSSDAEKSGNSDNAVIPFGKSCRYFEKQEIATILYANDHVTDWPKPPDPIIGA